MVVHERIQHRSVEEFIDIPVPVPQEEIVHVPVKEYQDRHHHVEAQLVRLTLLLSSTFPVDSFLGLARCSPVHGVAPWWFSFTVRAAMVDSAVET